MKQYNLSKLISQAESSLISYLASSLPVGNHSNQNKLGERFFSLWQTQTFKGPYIESLPQYERTISLEAMEKLATDSRDKQFFGRMRPIFDWRSIDSASLKKFRRARHQLWKDNTSDAADETEATTLHRLWHRKLYRHQHEAFLQIALRKSNAIVATGTGSGKTECFLIPLLYALLTEEPAERSRPGIRAILLYPMNALVEDQMSRLRRLLFWINLRAVESTRVGERISRQITFGRYTGETKVDEADRGLERTVSDEEIHELGELRYRKEMQHAPPDILVTNFTMLEYMLLRNDDRRLFKEPQLFKFLILDEVHSYRGTTGMEVSTLLRRFRNYLDKTCSSGPVRFRCVGTSATLGTEQDAKQKMADFATRLFASPFTAEQVISGKVKPAHLVSNSRTLDSESLLNSLVGLPGLAPILSSAFSIGEVRGEQLDGDIPNKEWEHLAEILGCPREKAASHAASGFERTEILGRIVNSSNAFHRLNEVFGSSQSGVSDFNSVVVGFWGENLTSARPADCKLGLASLLQLIQGARVAGDGLLSVRVHEFVREHRDAFLCIDPSHCPPESTTDGWWADLFVNHRTNCSVCSSVVYPLRLCRKCGFVLLEGWYRSKTGLISSERDDLLGKGQFRRILFRPISALTERLRDRLLTEGSVNLISICTQCGLRFSHENEDYAQTAIRDHARSCHPGRVVAAVEWSAESDVSLRECPYCDQEWFSEQEVVTPPTLSLYAAATILLEELKRAVDEPLEGTDTINKVLCFSDSRQQAAFIASRLQRTNEDFTFRQLIYASLRECSEPLSTRRLVSIIADQLVADYSLAQLFCERDEIGDESRIRKRIATLLFRDTCTEYRTLESLGLVTVVLPEKLMTRSREFLKSYAFTRDLGEDAWAAYTHFIFDWTFRFHRWAVSPGPLQPIFTELDRYGRQDRSISSVSGDQYSRTSGFSLKQENSKNRVFDFYKRLCKRENKALYFGDLASFKNFMEHLWEYIFRTSDLYARERTGVALPTDDIPFVAIAGNNAENLQVKLNWLALKWKLEEDTKTLFRCDCCGFVARGSVRAICPIRDCSGAMKETTLQRMTEERFSPARHYLALLRERRPKPLVVEEHTAQISPLTRRDIENSFRSEVRGSVDIISGSTTFELGIDLGAVNGVLLANMPPEVSNYRQRAGRAGRRAGMMPIVFTYVRQRPHDSYFWSKPEHFIAGPLQVPRFSLPSHEVLFRHSNAVLYSVFMQDYPTSTGLEGPRVSDFMAFAMNSQKEERLHEQAKNLTTELSKSLKAILAANPTLALTPDDCVTHFYKRLKHFQEMYSATVSGDGIIPTLSDYGILPSYNYPIYVDELRLYECPRTERPRRDLKLQRDRSISLNEYFPGKIVVANKVAIRSTGLWKGYKTQPFKYCKECAYIDARESRHLPTECPNGCGALVSLLAARPLGGFVGKVEHGLARQDPELFSVARSQFLFDPAGNPPPPLTLRGQAIRAAKQSSFNVDKSGARMRTFVPRPDSEQSLELRKAQLRDVALPGNQQADCLVLPAEGIGASDKYFLMHEFTTDILRIQVANVPFGKLLHSSPPFAAAMNSQDEAARRKAEAVWLWTFTQSLAIGGARLLQIDTREIAFTFRCAPADALLRREAILFDTAAGGAGYCDQLFEDMKGLFTSAVNVLDCPDGCGDSCYSCLRSFDNQAVHSRLNRFFVLDAMKKFVELNWS